MKSFWRSCRHSSCLRPPNTIATPWPWTRWYDRRRRRSPRSGDLTSRIGDTCVRLEDTWPPRISLSDLIHVCTWSPLLLEDAPIVGISGLNVWIGSCTTSTTQIYKLGQAFSATFLRRGILQPNQDLTVLFCRGLTFVDVAIHIHEDVHLVSDRIVSQFLWRHLPVR